MFQDLAIEPMQAVVFGLLTLPITVWIIYTDVTDMKIKNGAVLGTLAVFVLAGPLVLPLDLYAWRYVTFILVLAICFLMSLTAGMGAGDAKYIAAASPFVAGGDFGALCLIYVIWATILLIGMGIARRSQALRTSAPGWVWFAEERKRHIPFGLTLAPTVSTYFFFGAIA